MIWLTVFGDVILFAAGYAASIYTWSYIRTAWTGAHAEVATLEARIAAIKAAFTVTPLK